MKLKHLAVLVFALSCSLSAHAWPTCKGQWVSVPKTTTGGTLYSTGDLLFQCQPIPVPDPKPAPPSVTNSNTNSATSGSTSTSGASATGGNATATGGSQKQGQNQGQSQSANSSASNGGNNSTYESSSVYNQVRQAPLAYAPTIIPSNCQGSLSGGVSAPIGGVSLGGSKADKNCQRLALAAAFAAMRNFAAAAKVLCSTDGAKTAHLTLADCQTTFDPPVTRVEYIPLPAAPIVVPPAQPQIILVEPPVTVTAPKVVHSVKHVKKTCPTIPDSIKKPLEK
jgi:hypothetical protein